MAFDSDDLVDSDAGRQHQGYRDEGRSLMGAVTDRLDVSRPHLRPGHRLQEVEEVLEFVGGEKSRKATRAPRR